MSRKVFICPIVVILTVSMLGLSGCASLEVSDYNGHTIGTSPGTFFPPILY